MIDKKQYVVKINYDFCKNCRLCIYFCKRIVFGSDEEGRTVVANNKLCNGCQLCEIHCPDIALEIVKIGDENG